MALALGGLPSCIHLSNARPAIYVTVYVFNMGYINAKQLFKRTLPFLTSNACTGTLVRCPPANEQDVVSDHTVHICLLVWLVGSLLHIQCPPQDIDGRPGNIES